MLNQTHPFSNALIVVFSIIFFPIAIFLCVVRFNAHKGNIPLQIYDLQFYREIIRTAGFVILPTFIIIAGLGNDGAGFGMLVGILCFVVGRNLSKQAIKLQERHARQLKDLQDHIQQQQLEETQRQAAAAAEAERIAQAKKIECRNCGSHAILMPDESTVCEYCHSVISYA